MFACFGLQLPFVHRRWVTPYDNPWDANNIGLEADIEGVVDRHVLEDTVKQSLECFAILLMQRQTELFVFPMCLAHRCEYEERCAYTRRRQATLATFHRIHVVLIDRIIVWN